MPNGELLLLLVAGMLLCAAGGAVGGWHGAAWVLVGICLCTLALSLWTMVEG